MTLVDEIVANQEINDLKEEVEKLKAQVQWYVDKVAEGYFGRPGLKGYQELGQQLCEANGKYMEVAASYKKYQEEMTEWADHAEKTNKRLSRFLVEEQVEHTKTIEKLKEVTAVLKTLTGGPGVA